MKESQDRCAPKIEYVSHHESAFPTLLWMMRKQGPRGNYPIREGTGESSVVNAIWHASIIGQVRNLKLQVTQQDEAGGLLKSKSLQSARE